MTKPPLSEFLLKTANELDPDVQAAKVARQMFEQSGNHCIMLNQSPTYDHDKSLSNLLRSLAHVFKQYETCRRN